MKNIQIMALVLLKAMVPIELIDLWKIDLDESRALFGFS